MKFHIKAAADLLTKGLDPTKPYAELGPDGMLAIEPATPISIVTTPVHVENLPVAEEVVVPVTEIVPVLETTTLGEVVPVEQIQTIPTEVTPVLVTETAPEAPVVIDATPAPEKKTRQGKNKTVEPKAVTVSE